MSRTLAIVTAFLLTALPAAAQTGLMGPPDPLAPAIPTAEPFLLPGTPNTESGLNPMRLIGDAAALLPGLSQQPTDIAASNDAPPGAVPPPASNGSPSESDRKGFSVALNIMVLMTVLSLVPAIMLMTTCFVRILVVMALLRQALGTQSVPPAQVVSGLALIMTMLVMSPTIDRVWNEAVQPWQAGEIADYDELWVRAKQPLRDYMFDQIEATQNWSSVYMILNYRGVDTSEPGELTRADVDMISLVPAYMLSELKTAFLLGFRVYLPFLVIDMVIASILISMSMMMLPPILISVPFKLLLFVLADGWQLVVGSLLQSFVQDGYSSRLSAEPATGALMFLILLVRPARKAPTAGEQLPILTHTNSQGGRHPWSTTRPLSTSSARR
ncbi:MAG: flagellar type III secretion system pore protein FliP [Planctomycetota bacterium]